MGRSRRRQRRVTNERAAVAPTAASRPILAPTYVPVFPERAQSGEASAAVAACLVEAPVLPLEGLDPWTPIAGPALAVEEAPEEESSIPVIPCPDQLELRPWQTEVARSDEPEAESPSSLEACVAEEIPAEPVGPPAPPDPAELLYSGARAAAEEGHPDAAMAMYRELLSRYPRHVRARNNLALLLDAAGNHAGALAELDRALETDPEHTTLLTNRGALLGALGRYAAAERDLRRVLRVEPTNAEALFNLGVVMTKKGLWSEAVPLLRHVTELAPDRGQVFYYLGEALNHVDDLAGALAAYQSAVELQPSNARALYGLGIIYDRLARPDDAAAMYRRSREVARR